jgi:hypothetical protein
MYKTAIIMFLGLASVAFAKEPNCTTEKKDKWKDEKAFQKTLTAEGYKIRKFKVTKGNCYEIYGHNKEGKKVEIYFNPVTSEKTKEILH